MPSNKGNIRYAGLSKSQSSVNDTAVFTSGALLTYNIDTNLGSRSEAGTTTGIAANVEAMTESLSIGARLSGPFRISATDMLRRNGFGEYAPPPLQLRARDKDR
jgi:hypothetical protein